MRILRLVLHLFVGLSAVPVGWTLTSDPSGKKMGFDASWLRRGPFRSFLVPGLFLMTVHGSLNLLAAYGLGRRRRWAAPVSAFAGVVLVAWIAIQWWIMGYRHWSQWLWTVVFSFLTLAGLGSLRPETNQPDS